MYQVHARCHGSWNVIAPARLFRTISRNLKLKRKGKGALNCTTLMVVAECSPGSDWEVFRERKLARHHMIVESITEE